MEQSKVYISLVVFILLSGCATWQKSTPFEKAVYTCMLVTTATDMITTDRILDQGGSELNPLLGSHPNNEALYMFTGSKILIHTVLGHYSEFWRKYGWSGSCLAGTILTIHNMGEIE